MSGGSGGKELMSFYELHGRSRLGLGRGRGLGSVFLCKDRGGWRAGGDGAGRRETNEIYQLHLHQVPESYSKKPSVYLRSLTCGETNEISQLR